MLSILFVLLLPFVLTKLIPTPLGLRPEECVHRVRSNATIVPIEGGVHVFYPGQSQPDFLPELPHCVENMKNILSSRSLSSQKHTQTNVGVTDGWLDYVGYYPASFSSFTSFYTVPQTPTAKYAQTLYYFIGAVSDYGKSDDTILQPVLTYYPNSSSTGWSFASWNCCPSGQQHEATPVPNIQPGDTTLFGSVTTTTSTSSIVSQGNGQSSTLQVATDQRKWNWVDVTLEVYGVQTCEGLAQGPAGFTSMKMNDVNGNSINYQWNAPGPFATTCNGVTTVKGDSVYIQHN